VRALGYRPRQRRVEHVGAGTIQDVDAVQEYQVMLSPFDVRFGDFTGAFVNAVTE
jgi:hypothetical protein